MKSIVLGLSLWSLLGWAIGFMNVLIIFTALMGLCLAWPYICKYIRHRRLNLYKPTMLK